MRSYTGPLTRREAAAIAGAILLSGSRTYGQKPAIEQGPATADHAERTSLHQEIELGATPKRIFTILLDAKLFAVVTGMPATIDPNPGGAFSTFGGLIEGRNVELVPAQRIVQAWRPRSWEAGVYSIVHFELRPDNAGTLLTLDHTGFPDGDFDHLETGWQMRYWDPMKKFLASEE